MTSEERKGSLLDFVPTDYQTEFEIELDALLKQVTKKQRRYCAESGFDIETGKYTFEAIQTARSPLNEDSHE